MEFGRGNMDNPYKGLEGTDVPSTPSQPRRPASRMPTREQMWQDLMPVPGVDYGEDDGFGPNPVAESLGGAEQDHTSRVSEAAGSTAVSSEVEIDTRTIEGRPFSEIAARFGPDKAQIFYDQDQVAQRSLANTHARLDRERAARNQSL